MANVFRRHDEDHVFGDVRGVVTDALEVAGDEDKVEGWLDRRRILQHEGQQFPEDLRLQIIEAIIFVQHLLGEDDVAADERIEGIAQHGLGDTRHSRDVDQLLHRRVRRVAARRLRDVHRQIADAFEVRVDLDRGDDRPQVGRHRLEQCQQREATVVDLDVQLVDRLVADQGAVERVGVVITSAAMTLNPLTTAALAMLLLGEQMGWHHLAGGALIIGVSIAVILIIRRNIGEIDSKRRELHVLNQELESLVDARTSELQRANAEIQRT